MHLHQRFYGLIVRSDVSDLDIIDSTSINKCVCYLQKIREELRAMSKKEYLSMIVHTSKDKKQNLNNVNAGEVVLIGDCNIKRTNGL